jgi:O-acetylhomoserine/O-acetylserine sulfhydrylase-like pyridoxal-dependent enzyme
MPQLLMYIGGRGTNQIAGFVIKALACDWDTENSAPILNSVKQGTQENYINTFIDHI